MENKNIDKIPLTGKFINHLHKLGRPEESDTYRAFVNVGLGPASVAALVDCGNLWRTAMSERLFRKLGYDESHLRQVGLTECGTAKRGEGLTVMGELKTPIHITLGRHPTKFKVRPVVIRDLSHDLNLAGPWLAKYGFVHFMKENKLRINGKYIPLHAAQGTSAVPEAEVSQSNIYLAKRVKVPARSIMFLRLHAPEVAGGVMPAGDCFVTGSAGFQERTDLHPFQKVLVKCDKAGRLFGGVINSLTTPITLEKGTQYGTATLACEMQEEDRYLHRVSFIAPGTRKSRSRERSGKERWTVGQKTEWLRRELRLDKNPALDTAEKMGKAIALLIRNFDVFSVDGAPGRTDWIEHRINTKPINPIKMRARPINPIVEEDLKRQVQKWLDADVIEPSESPWAFGLVAARKKGGAIRWCVDYRRLNEATVKDTYPLPNMEDNLSRLSSSTIFSALDASGAYHVIPLAKEDREKTAFATPFGLWQFKTMPFGLCNGGSTYSRLAAMVLHGIPWSMAMAYIDDILVHARDFDQHLVALDRVFQAHIKAGLKLTPGKCKLFQFETEYLGHWVSKDGIQPLKSHTKVIAEWPVPKTRAALRTFLGKINYYRRFIRHFAHVAKPLTDWMKDPDDTGGKVDVKERKNRARRRDQEPIQLDAAAVAAFKDLRDRLMSPPILAFPRFDSEHPFILDTDWSKDHAAIGATVSQVGPDGQEHPITYGSKKLNKAQTNYSAHKGEMFAGAYFMKQYKYYLICKKFVWRSDHDALKFLQTQEPPDTMVFRWMEMVSSFDYEPQHRPGTQHGNADALSRIDHGEPPDPEEVTAADSLMQMGTAILSAIGACAPPLLRSPEMIKEAQKADDVLSKVRQWVRAQEGPTNLEKHGLSRTGRVYADLLSEMEINQDGVLVRRTDPNHRDIPAARRPCIPEDHQRAMVLEFHKSGGHMRVATTLTRLQQRVYFPHMKQIVQDVLSTCVPCQAKLRKGPDQRHTHVNVPSNYPFRRLSIDFVGPLPITPAGNRYVLTVRDTFTRWIEAFPLPAATALATVRVLEREIFCRYGVPELLHSDRGTQFTSNLHHAVAKEYGIEVTETPSYNPKSNPVERLHRDLGTMLRAVTYGTQLSWEDVLPQCLFALRTAVCRMTGRAPFELLFGRHATQAVDLAFGKPPNPPSGDLDYHEYVVKLRERMDLAQKYARDNIAMQVRRQRMQYHQERQTFRVGARVWVFFPPEDSKLGKFWSGPWVITEAVSKVVFVVTPGPEMRSTKPPLTVSIDRLKLYRFPDPPRNVLPPSEEAPGDALMTEDEFAEMVDIPQPPAPVPQMAQPPARPASPPPPADLPPPPADPMEEQPPGSPMVEPEADNQPLPALPPQAHGTPPRAAGPPGRARHPPGYFRRLAGVGDESESGDDEDETPDFDPRKPRLYAVGDVDMSSSSDHQGGTESISSESEGGGAESTTSSPKGEKPKPGKSENEGKEYKTVAQLWRAREANSGRTNRMTAIQALEGEERTAELTRRAVRPNPEWLQKIEWSMVRGRTRARSQSSLSSLSSSGASSETLRTPRSSSAPPVETPKLSREYAGDLLPWGDIRARLGNNQRGMKRFTPAADLPNKRRPRADNGAGVPLAPRELAEEPTERPPTEDRQATAGAPRELRTARRSLVDRLIGDGARDKARAANDGIAKICRDV